MKYFFGFVELQSSNYYPVILTYAGA